MKPLFCYGRCQALLNGDLMTKHCHGTAGNLIVRFCLQKVSLVTLSSTFC